MGGRDRLSAGEGARATYFVVIEIAGGQECPPHTNETERQDWLSTRASSDPLGGERAR